MHDAHAIDVFVHPERKAPKIQPLKAWRHMRNLIADKEDTEQVFHIVEALSGKSFINNFNRFVSTEAGRRELSRRTFLPPMLDDHETLRRLPEGTVGRAYVDFMEREGLTAQGLVDESLKFRSKAREFDDDYQWFANRLRDTHDLFHVLTGYNRDGLGEASLLAFTYSQQPGPGILFIAYMGCRTIRKVAPPEARIMACFWEGKRNGAAAAKIVEQDIEALLREPLDEARTRLRIRRPELYERAFAILAQRGYTSATQVSEAREFVRHGQPPRAA